VMRAMEKDRSRRYQTMADVERDLERLLAGDQNVGFVPRAAGLGALTSTAPKRWPLLVAGGVVLVAGAAIALDLGRPSKEPPAPPPAVAPAPVVQPPTPPPVEAPPPAAAVAPAVQPAAPARKKQRARPGATAAGAAAPAAAAPAPAGKSREMRLPSASKEAYPDK